MRCALVTGVQTCALPITLVRERVWGGYIESEFGGTLGGRPINLVAGVRVERTQAHVDALATGFTELVTLANDQTQFGVTTSGATRTDVNNSRSEEHTSELQSLMRKSYAVFCLKK